MEHGTKSKYVHDGCRCGDCRAANTLASKKYRKTPNGAEAVYRATRKYLRSNVRKSKAWHAVARAVENGDLIRPNACDLCGVRCKPDGSHDDYDKPLEVEWLCRLCHITKDRSC